MPASFPPPAETPKSLSPSADLLRQVLDFVPAAAYTCDAEGLITYFNRAAVELWGRAPQLNDPVDRYCGSFRLFRTDGTPVEHSECWMALALKSHRAYSAE